MSKDHFPHLFIKPDIDSRTMPLSHHRTNIITTGIIVKDPYSYPEDREREEFEKVITTQRGPTNEPVIYYRRIK